MEQRATPYDHLSRDQLIERIVELEAQVRRLLEHLGNPPTPDNSSLPPSQGRKANLPDREPKAKPTRRGFHRRELHPNPDAIVD